MWLIWLLMMTVKESVMSSIDSNRAFWFSGSAGIPGGPQADGAGGPVIEDTNHNPGKSISRISLIQS